MKVELKAESKATAKKVEKVKEFLLELEKKTD